MYPVAAGQKIQDLGYMEDPDAITIKFGGWVEGQAVYQHVFQFLDGVLWNDCSLRPHGLHQGATLLVSHRGS